MKLLSSRYLPLVFFVVLFILIYLISRFIPAENIRLFVQNSGPFAPLLIILSLIFTSVIAPLGGTPFLFVGFYLYGSNVIFLWVIAAFTSSIINFWIAKIWGRSLVEKLAGKSSIEKVDKLIASYSLQTLFIFRILLIGLHDVVSYAAGLTRMKFRDYVVVSSLGIVPGTIIWYIAASQINSPVAFTGLNFILIYTFAGIFLIGVILRKKFKK